MQISDNILITEKRHKHYNKAQLQQNLAVKPDLF